MRSIARFLALAAGLAMMISAFCPWFREITPAKLRVRYLFQGVPSGEPLSRLADESTPFVNSVGAILVVAGVLVLLGGLFGGRTLVWLGSLLGLATVAMFYLQILLEHKSVPGNQYGATIGQAGVLVALIAGLWPRHRAPVPRPAPIPVQPWQTPSQ